MCFCDRTSSVSSGPARTSHCCWFRRGEFVVTFNLRYSVLLICIGIVTVLFIHKQHWFSTKINFQFTISLGDIGSSLNKNQHNKVRCVGNYYYTCKAALKMLTRIHTYYYWIPILFFLLVINVFQFLQEQESVVSIFGCVCLSF